MAAKIGIAGYFATVKDLSLTPEQETLLESLLPMTRRICKRFTDKYYDTDHDFSLLDTEDLVQMALVALCRMIKSRPVADIKLYSCVVIRSCQNCIRLNAARGAARYHNSLKSAHYVVSEDDVNRVHQRLYLDTVLSILSNTNSKILLHYYGLGIDQHYQEYPALKARRSYCIGKIRDEIQKGELPTWETE